MIKLKKMNSKTTLAGIAFLILLSLTACKKTPTPTPTPTVKYGNAIIEIEHSCGATSPITYGSAVVNPLNGDTMLFTNIKYYVSNIKLKKSDGTWWEDPYSYYLIDLSLTDGNLINLDSVPEGDYTDLSYTIGVDSLHNVSGVQTGSLSTSNNMFWSWNTGYIFLKLEGVSPQISGGFSFHLGGFSGANNAVASRTLSFNGGYMSVRTYQTPQLHLSGDIGKTWKNTTSIRSNKMVHMPGADAVKMVNSWADAIEFEHIH